MYLLQHVSKQARVALEEQVGGKATGREALLAARHAKADRLHGGAWVWGGGGDGRMDIWMDSIDTLTDRPTDPIDGWIEGLTSLSLSISTYTHKTHHAYSGARPGRGPRRAGRVRSGVGPWGRGRARPRAAGAGAAAGAAGAAGGGARAVRAVWGCGSVVCGWVSGVTEMALLRCSRPGDGAFVCLCSYNYCTWHFHPLNRLDPKTQKRPFFNIYLHVKTHRRLEEHKAKEAATMQNLLATLGLKPGDRVTIQKRPAEG